MTTNRLLNAIRKNPDFMEAERCLDSLDLTWELYPPTGKGHPYLLVEGRMRWPVQRLQHGPAQLSLAEGPPASGRYSVRLHAAQAQQLVNLRQPVQVVADDLRPEVQQGRVDRLVGVAVEAVAHGLKVIHFAPSGH